MPLFELPAPPSYRLTNAPLAQALAQVRFPLIANFESLKGIAPLQERLAPTFPYMEQEKVQEFSFAIGPDGGQGGAAETVTWKLTNDEGETVSIGPGAASLSCDHSYRGVETFTEHFRLLLDSLADAHLPRCDRIGVRFLSLAECSTSDDRQWRDWFRPELTGWPGSEVMGTANLVSSISQAQITAPPIGDLAGPPSDVQAVVRHGAVPAGAVVPGVPPVIVETGSYLLDIDAFVVGGQAFNPSSLTDQFALLHDQIDRFFFWSLTEQGLTHFGYQDVDSK